MFLKPFDNQCFGRKSVVIKLQDKRDSNEYAMLAKFSFVQNELNLENA